MTDNLTSEQRSRCMSKIKSKWTSQELKLHNLLKGKKIKHKMHPCMDGSPDILLLKTNTAVFLHGCFWHKCPACYKEPKSRRDYWIPKIEKNVLRDVKNKKILKENGYLVIIIWEHELRKSFKKIFEGLVKNAGKKGQTETARRHI